MIIPEIFITSHILTFLLCLFLFLLLPYLCPSLKPLHPLFSLHSQCQPPTHPFTLSSRTFLITQYSGRDNQIRTTTVQFRVQYSTVQMREEYCSIVGLYVQCRIVHGVKYITVSCTSDSTAHAMKKSTVKIVHCIAVQYIEWSTVRC